MHEELLDVVQRMFIGNLPSGQERWAAKALKSQGGSGKECGFHP